MKQAVKIWSATLLAAIGAYCIDLPGLRTNGRFLETPTGEHVVLMGMDHETVWLDVTGTQFSQLAMTGANAVRMAWTIHGNNSSNSLATAAAQLDVAVAACIKQDMIPIPEFHDATGTWSGLQSLVTAWTSPEYVKVIQKHEQYMIVNIGNEVGDGNVTDAQYKSGYISAVSQMRRAGIRTPIMIDADGWGQNYSAISNSAQAIIAADSLHNTMFSVHMYWTVGSYGSKAAVITAIQNSLSDAVNKNIPMIVGEFGEAFTSNGTVLASDSIPFRNIMAECNKRQIGWLAWSWGGNSPQTDLNMSTNGTYAGLQTWGLYAMVTDPNSVKNNAVRPKYITQNVASGVFPSSTTNHTGTSTSTPAPVNQMLLEAENGQLSGTATTAQDASRSNGAYVNLEGGSIVWTDSLTKSGTYDIVLNLDSPFGPKTNTFAVDGDSTSFSVDSSVSFGPVTVAKSVSLNPGKHTFTLNASWGWINVDNLKLSAPTTGIRSLANAGTPKAVPILGGLKLDGLDRIRHVRVRDASGHLLALSQPTGVSVRIPINARGLLLISFENEQGTVFTTKLILP